MTKQLKTPIINIIIMESILKDLKTDVKQWWVSLLVGIVYVIGAITILCLPLSSYVAISLVFSCSVLVGGIFEIVFALSNTKTLNSWGWYLVGGLIDFIIGIVLCVSPGLSMEILPILLAFWFIFKGFTLMGYSLDLKSLQVKNWGWSFLFSILIILFAFLILFKPMAGAIYITYLLSFVFLAIGMFKIIISFDLRRVYKKYKEMKNQELI